MFIKRSAASGGPCVDALDGSGKGLASFAKLVAHNVPQAACCMACHLGNELWLENASLDSWPQAVINGQSYASQSDYATVSRAHYLLVQSNVQ